MARPSKYTWGRIKRILKHIRNGGTKRGACGAAGITETSLARWGADKVDLVDAIKRAQAFALDKAEKELRRRAFKSTSDTCLIFWLKTQGGYQDRVTVENTGTVRHEHSHEVKEAEKLLRRIKPEGRRAVIRAFNEFRADPN